MASLYMMAVFGCMVPAVLGFGTGAPAGACFTMTPGHTGGSKQTSTAPYKIELNATSLMAQGAIQVTIKGNPDGNFQGFLVQARSGTTIVNGKFSLVGSAATAQTLTCDGNTDNSATHTSEADKASVTLVWTPPSNLDTSKELMFQATVAQAKMTWWEGIQSVKLTTGAAANIVPNMAAVLAVVLALIYFQ